MMATTYEQLLQALEQSQSGYDRSQAALGPLEQKRMEYSTKRSRGIIPMLIESAYDHFKQKKYEPQYQKALLEAMGSARGVDKAQAEADAYARFMEEQKAQAAAQAEEARMGGLYQGAGVPEGQAALLAAGGKLPAAAKQTNDIQNAIAMGFQPGTPEFKQYLERATVGDQGPMYNITIPTGYAPLDPNNPAAGFAPIPGGPVAQKQEALEEKQGRIQAGEAVKLASLNDTVNKAVALLGPTTTGIPGAIMSDIPGSSRKALNGYIDTLKSNLGFDKLAEMRANSPTGGALGNVSNIELGLLTSAWGSLDPNQPPEVLRENLTNIQTRLANMNAIMSGRMPEGYDASGNPASGEDEQEAVNPQTGEVVVFRNGQWVRK